MSDFIRVSLKGAEYTFTALDFEQLQTLEGDFDTLRSLRDGVMPDATQRKAIVALEAMLTDRLKGAAGK